MARPPYSSSSSAASNFVRGRLRAFCTLLHIEVYKHPYSRLEYAVANASSGRCPSDYRRRLLLCTLVLWNLPQKRGLELFPDARRAHLPALSQPAWHTSPRIGRCNVPMKWVPCRCPVAREEVVILTRSTTKPGVVDTGASPLSDAGPSSLFFHRRF